MTGTKVAKTKGTGHEVAQLADGEVFVRRDGKGVIRPMWKKVNLKKGRDTYQVAGKTMLTVSGYQICNRIASISTMKPSTIFIEGVERQNPYIERAPLTQEAVNVTARALAIGFGPNGNPVIVDKTVILNLRQYLLCDLKNKIGKFPECGYFGPGEIKGDPADSWQSKPTYNTKATHEVKPRAGAVMKFMPVFEITPGDYVGYWYDMAHPEIIAVFEAQDTRQKFPERNAQTMAERNAMAIHSCMPVRDCSEFVNPQSGDASVVVYGYRHDASADDLKALAQAAADGDLTGVKRIGGAEAQLIDTGTERIEYEDAQVEEDIAAQEAAEPEKEKKTTKKRESKNKSGSKPESETQTTAKKEEKPPAEKKPDLEEVYRKDGYRMAAEGEISCAKCKYMKIRKVSGRPECTCGPEPHYAIGLKRTCDKADKKKEKPAEEKPAGGKKEDKKGWGDIYDEQPGAPPPTDPETGEVADKEVSTEEKPEVTEPEPEKAEKPSEVSTEQEKKSDAHKQLEGAENIMSNPKQINDVAHEIFFAFEEGMDWRSLTDEDKETLLTEMKKRTQGGR